MLKLLTFLIPIAAATYMRVTDTSGSLVRRVYMSEDSSVVLNLSELPSSLSTKLTSGSVKVKSDKQYILVTNESDNLLSMADCTYIASPESVVSAEIQFLHMGESCVAGSNAKLQVLDVETNPVIVIEIMTLYKGNGLVTGLSVAAAMSEESRIGKKKMVAPPKYGPVVSRADFDSFKLD